MNDLLFFLSFIAGIGAALTVFIQQIKAFPIVSDIFAYVKENYERNIYLTFIYLLRVSFAVIFVYFTGINPFIEALPMLGSLPFVAAGALVVGLVVFATEVTKPALDILYQLRDSSRELSSVDLEVDSPEESEVTIPNAESLALKQELKTEVDKFMEGNS